MLLSILASPVPLSTLSGLAAPARAADSAPDGLKGAGEGLKKFGRKVGEAGKEAGHEIAEGAKRIFYKGKKVSAPLLHDVQRATRSYWAKVMGDKDRTIEDLRKENEDLRDRLDEEDD